MLRPTLSALLLMSTVAATRTLNLPRRNGQPWGAPEPVEHLDPLEFMSRVRPAVEAVEFDWPTGSSGGINASNGAQFSGFSNVRAMAPVVPDHLRLVENDALHPLVMASWKAFAAHRPLVLTPDAIWLVIAQGVSKHINQHAEALRGLMVKHTGEGEKVTIAIRNDALVSRLQDPLAFKELPEQTKATQWRSVFSEFSDSTRTFFAHDELYQLFTANFSTTTPISKAAADIVLLEAVQSYFDKRVITLCHIPQFVLQGTAEDWDKIVKRVKALKHHFENHAPDDEVLSMRWWTDPLLQVVENMSRTVRVLDEDGHDSLQADHNEVLLNFWWSWFKEENESGASHIRGAICAFFPYLKDRAGEPYRNTNTDWTKIKDIESCMNSDHIPGPLSKTPFVWEYLGTELPMQFVAGLLGVVEHTGSAESGTVPAGALQPVMGYIVAEPSKQEK